MEDCFCQIAVEASLQISTSRLASHIRKVLWTYSHQGNAEYGAAERMDGHPAPKFSLDKEKQTLKTQA
jgi:hypothetical protein